MSSVQTPKSIFRRVTQTARLAAARLGIQLLHRSGVFDGFFNDWRWATFDYGEQRGLHILPVHYYSPIPKVSALELSFGDPLYFRADDVVVAKGIETLRQFSHDYRAKFLDFATRQGDGHKRFVLGEAPYSTVEAETLYGLIRTRRPARIIEIGCGKTTLLISEAIADEAAFAYTPTYTCIEPYRPAYLAQPPSQVSAFIDKRLQNLDLRIFDELGAGDILFIDSSHVVAAGSDTVLEILRILPMLRPGVLIHFHDIFLPYEYPADWFGERFFWAEQYMLSAYLQGNSQMRPVLPLHQMSRERTKELVELFPRLTEPGQRPGAYWIEVA